MEGVEYVYHSPRCFHLPNMSWHYQLSGRSAIEDVRSKLVEKAFPNGNEPSA